MAMAWNMHTDYWLSVERNEVIRYEDLRSRDHIQYLARMLEYLLPPEALPSMEKLVCADDDRHVWYQSRKAAPFYSWDRYSDEVRTHLLETVEVNWCRLGFEQLLKQEKGIQGVDCKGIPGPINS